MELLRARAVEPEFREAVSDYLDDTADSLESKVEGAEAIIELFDRALLPVAIAAFLSGMGLLVTKGIAWGPVEIVTGGILGLTASGFGRTMLRLRAVTSRTAIKRLRRLGDRVREIP